MTTDKHALATTKNSEEPWRGDEHKLQLEAAREAGLETSEAQALELDLYTRGFKTSLVLQDSDDNALVARGRTVLEHASLIKSLRPVLTYLTVPRDAWRARVHDGEFELRIDAKATQATAPVIDAGKGVLQIWLAAGLFGFAIFKLALLGPFSSGAAAILWGLGLLYGSWELRRSMVSGRAMLGARLSLGLAMLAQEEQLILPATTRPNAAALPPSGDTTDA
jgi:hypothetical protein